MQIPLENEDPRIHASRACSSRPRRARIWGFLGTLGKSARPVGGALAPVLPSVGPRLEIMLVEGFIVYL